MRALSDVIYWNTNHSRTRLNYSLYNYNNLNVVRMLAARLCHCAPLHTYIYNLYLFSALHINLFIHIILVRCTLDLIIYKLIKWRTDACVCVCQCEFVYSIDDWFFLRCEIAFARNALLPPQSTTTSLHHHHHQQRSTLSNQIQSSSAAVFSRQCSSAASYKYSSL